MQQPSTFSLLRQFPDSALSLTIRASQLVCCVLLSHAALAASTDYDGDGKSDILWQNAGSGAVVVWRMDGPTRLENSGVTTVSDPAWRIVGDGDYDGDNKTDVLWRNVDTGQIVFWKMDGASIVTNLGVAFVTDSAWQIIASPDLNGDGKADLLWRHGLTGQVVYWQMNGATIVTNANIDTVSDLSWQVVANGDFDGDDNTDILWRHQLSGQIAMWTMDGATRLGNFNVTTVASFDWQIMGAANFDADGKADILWRNFATGQNVLWFMNGPGIVANLGVTSVADFDWEIVGNGDYDGDLDADILWRHADNGQIALWEMDDALLTANLSVDTVSDPAWLIKDVQIPSPYSGLGSRPPNVSCIAREMPTNNASIAVVPAFPNLPPLIKPVEILQSPADGSPWYVVQQDGQIYSFSNDSMASSLALVLDIDGRVDSVSPEAGLLGIAFHPGFATNGEVFVSYTAPGLQSRISRFISGDGGVTIDPASEQILLTLNQPSSNHNGGNVTFGPDGKLYAGFGDGGGAGGDPNDNGQNTTNLFGTLIRIDVDTGFPYSIPAGGPFAQNPLCNTGSGTMACPEIFAWGFRNPWRWSFDSSTGGLWLGDVGERRWEEVDIVQLGGNYGWRCREGAHDFDTTGNCPPGLIDPVIEYGNAVGNSVTGGYVYRGTGIPELIGRYVFADYVEGKIFASTSDGQGNYGYEMLLNTNFNISSFAEEENGELLFLNYGGDIRRIVESGGSSVNTIPDQLSLTGCVDSIDATKPSTGMIPYDINVPFWSDDAVKERFYAIPDGTTIDVDTDGDWLFPIGTVLMKNFRLDSDSAVFETRLFMRHTNGEWAGYTFEWNQAGTDANRVVGGKVKDVEGQSWTYPSESQCMNCHTQTANFSLGIEHAQLNRQFTYPATGLHVNQLNTAGNIGMLTSPLTNDPENLPRLYDLTDPATPPPVEDLTEAGRSYLHSNCSGCHRPLGPTPSSMDLRFDTGFSATNTCDVTPTSGDLGVPNARLVSPGIAGESIIPNRMNRRDVHGMPPLGSAIPDADGVALVNQWINSLTACP